MELTKGLGAGANPEKGREAALESSHEIRELLRNDGTKMLFITAGMGGGTGTGAAPIIAQIAKELDILTVGIVTLPFDFEGKSKMDKALKGVEELKKGCDSVITILNQRLIEIYGDLSQSMAFEKADDIIATSAKCIAEIVTIPGQINVDFEDVNTVMRNAFLITVFTSSKSTFICPGIVTISAIHFALVAIISSAFSKAIDWLKSP